MPLDFSPSPCLSLGPQPRLQHWQLQRWLLNRLLSGILKLFRSVANSLHSSYFIYHLCERVDWGCPDGPLPPSDILFQVSGLKG